MKLEKHPDIYSCLLDDAEQINTELLSGFIDNKDSDRVRRSHYFEGRYENIYIDDEIIGAISRIKQSVIELVSKIKGASPDQLKAGLWFNAMYPGHKTLAHRHDDDDEIMSAVYYVAVPENSGKLVLNDSRFTTMVTPEAGLFVLFPPDMTHEVTENMSQDMRLSLGINIGPTRSEQL